MTLRVAVQSHDLLVDRPEVGQNALVGPVALVGLLVDLLELVLELMGCSVEVGLAGVLVGYHLLNRWHLGLVVLKVVLLFLLVYLTLKPLQRRDLLGDIELRLEELKLRLFVFLDKILSDRTRFLLASYQKLLQVGCLILVRVQVQVVQVQVGSSQRAAWLTQAWAGGNRHASLSWSCGWDPVGSRRCHDLGISRSPFGSGVKIPSRNVEIWFKL